MRTFVFMKTPYPMLRIAVLFSLWLIVNVFCHARVDDIRYTREDSLLVVKLLEEVPDTMRTEALPLYFARRLAGTPYVGATLEVDVSEPLVVNLRQLDCMTLVENALALSLAYRDADRSFRNFCCRLERLRYADGKRAGYPSRNHYFSQWACSNERFGTVREITSADISSGCNPFTSFQRLDLHYMSAHADKYPLLRGRTADIARIRQAEKAFQGKRVAYIPVDQLNRTKDDLSFIHDGDIAAIVTRMDGLDTSHLGFLFWRGDRLYMLHASSVHKKVVEETCPLYEYMCTKSSQLGIRVVRMK